ncbi:DUF3050 domain-containing protein [Sphingobacterium rhinopitheci]|uniref:DUF3050 domain-containing protein n=1 Tax=Sphingobacterium rhinopitheci TaxID=2781960 RepID=UPI001F518FC9|nr:DUF3050 domain-containing protein [Sphingobacterium rhinopitheci]MCI0921380.1 DUF3050 domain-containing protein [Sphingobacterium rhinopitheci]
MNIIEEINAAIEGERAVLLQHPLYKKIKTVADLRLFTEGHVFAVWDFMSLLKALQVNLTCTQVPWFASEYPQTRYLINEIVLTEESDEYLDGRRLSHFEMYLESMRDMGADISYIDTFITNLKTGLSIEAAIERLEVDARIKDFLRFTFDIIASNKTHNIASAFTFGREDLIPDMFSSILKEIQSAMPEVDLGGYIYYFERHIQLDADEHGPLAMKMIFELVADDPLKLEEVKETAKAALVKRKLLWDAIYDQIVS